MSEVRRVALRTFWGDTTMSEIRRVTLRTFWGVTHFYAVFFSITSRQRSAPADLDTSKFDVTIYTGGFETTLGMPHPNRFSTYDDLLDAVNLALARKHNGLQVDYVCNCTNVGDVKSKRLLYHWGGNTNTMGNMIQTHFAVSCLEDLHEDLAGLSAGPGKKISILMLCRSGKHRSVAAAAMVRYCLRDTQRFKVVGTNHLSQHRWPRKFCTTCVDCRNDAPDRATVKADVAAMWTHELKTGG